MAFTTRAAAPGAEQLLPAETLVMLTVKDFPDATNSFWKSSLGRLWNDDAMRGARDKLNARLTNEIHLPLQRELKINLNEHLDLLRGQVTVALTKSIDEKGTAGFLLLADSKDKSEALKSRLDDLRKKWSDAGRVWKAEKIRDIEFTSYQFTEATLQKIARAVTGKGVEAADDPEAEAEKVNLLVGQSQTLLVAGTQARDIEKVLARQGGGTVPSLGELPVFQGNYAALFRDAPIYGWLDFKPLFDQMVKPEPTAPGAQAPSGIGNLRIEKVIPALGLGELKSVALRVAMPPEGYDIQLFVTAPEGARQGLLKILAPPAKDASPPPFVPADAVKFHRVRIDIQQAWTVFEGVLMKIDPSVAGIVQLMLGAAGKDKDPDFDLRKSLIDAIGDDYISYSKATKGSETPTLTLIGARNAEALVNGVKVIARMLPEPVGTTPWKVREFLGRKIQTMEMGTNALNMVASGGYVAISSDNAILEEHLRSADTPPKPLRETPGFMDAAQKVGGANTGWFTFENQVETMRASFADAKANPDRPPSDSNALAVNFSFSSEDKPRSLPDWIDAASLPPFEQVAKYFFSSLLSVSATPEGISVKIAVPTPPGLK